MKRFRWLLVVVGVAVVFVAGVWLIGRNGIQVTVPPETWKGEVLAMFGNDGATVMGDSTFGVKVSEPSFEKDPEPDRIRLTVNFDLDLGEDAKSVRGQVAIRTKLRLDRAGGRVLLHDVQMTDFILHGEASGYEPVVRPALEDLLAAELEGYPAFTLPKDAPWWQRTGQDLLQNVVVRDGEIVVEMGW